MHEDHKYQSERDEVPYENFNSIDFTVITVGMKRLPFLKDDVYLGMQGINVGIADSVITHMECELRREWLEIERTPAETAMAVSALSQMWIFGLYEVLRLWRDRMFDFGKLYQNGGIVFKVGAMPEDELSNHTIEIRKAQMLRYSKDASYRSEIKDCWEVLFPIYRMTELIRMNLAKHCAPGKDNMFPRAPGYGRINRWCGSLDFELIDKDGTYYILNRRNIADSLRAVFKSME